MITLREAATGLLNSVVSAIESGDWKVDGACDPTVEIIRLKNALTKPDREWVPLTDEQISDLWDGHTVPVFGKTGINPIQQFRQRPIVFARAIEAKLKAKNSL